MMIGLPGLRRTKGNTQTAYIRNESGAIATDPTDIKKTEKEHY